MILDMRIVRLSLHMLLVLAIGSLFQACVTLPQSIPPELEEFRPQLQEANRLSHRGEHKAAVKILRSLAVPNQSAFLWNLVAIESMKAGEHRQAESDFVEAVLSATPEYKIQSLDMILPDGITHQDDWVPADYWLARGSKRILSNRVDSGREDFDVVMKIDPQRVVDIVDLCNSLKGRKDKRNVGEICLFAFQVLNENQTGDPKTKAMRKDMFASTMVIAQETGAERLAAQAMFLLVKKWPVDAAIKFLRQAMRESHSDSLPIVLELLAKEHPNSSELIMARAAAMAEEGQYAELIDLAETLDPKSRYAPLVYPSAIDGAFRIDQSDRAISLARRMRGAQPYLREHHYTLIRILFRARKYARARSEALLGLMQFSGDLEMTRFLALAQSQTGDSKLALGLMEAVLRRRPRDAFAANFVAYSLAQENRSLDRAAQLVEVALKVSPDSISYLDTKAWIFYRQGKFEAAYRILAPIVELNSDSSELIFHLACIKHRLSRDGSAHFKQAMDMEKDPSQRGRFEREWKAINKD